MAIHSGIRDDGIKFQIVPSTRKITVPQAYKVIGSIGDHNSEQLTFQCPKVIDGHDVFACSDHYVKWKNVSNETGRSDVENITVDGDNLFFTWTIDSRITVKAGNISFSVHFEDIDPVGGGSLYRWSTTTCTECQVLETLTGEGGDEPIPVPEGYIKPTGTIEIETNGTHDVTSYASANVAVPVPTLVGTTITKNGTHEAPADHGYNRVVVDVQPTLQEKEITANGEHSPDTGYQGFSKVTVNVADIPAVLQEKTVYPSTSEQSITPDSGFDGLSKVTVTEMKLQEKTVTQNGAVIADSGYNGLEKVNVDVQPELQDKSIDVTHNGRTEVIADSGFYGLEKVTIDVDVIPDLQSKTVTENGEVTADEGYDGLSKVVVNVPEPRLQEKTVTANGEIIPDSGYDGLSKVTVNVAGEVLDEYDGTITIV